MSSKTMLQIVSLCSKNERTLVKKYLKSKVFFFEFHSVCDHSKNSETDGINKDNVLMIINFT